MCRAPAVPGRSQVRPAKTQVSLQILALCSESWQGSLWVKEHLKSLQADREDADQTAHPRRMMCVIAGRTCNFIGNDVPRLIWSLIIIVGHQIRSVGSPFSSKYHVYDKIPYAVCGQRRPDKPALMHRLIRAFVVRLQNQWIL